MHIDRTASEEGKFCYLVLRSDRKLLLPSSSDCDQFMASLLETARHGRCILYAFCLFENEAHLAIELRGTSKALLLRNLTPTHLRTSQDPFGSAALSCEHFEFNDPKLKQLFPLLLNRLHGLPVERKLCAHPAEWRWSSYRAYAGHEQIRGLTTKWERKLCRVKKQGNRKTGRTSTHANLCDLVSQWLARSPPLGSLDELIAAVIAAASVPSEQFLASSSSHFASFLRAFVAWYAREAGCSSVEETACRFQRDVSTLYGAIRRYRKLNQPLFKRLPICASIAY